MSGVVLAKLPPTRERDREREREREREKTKKPTKNNLGGVKILVLKAHPRRLLRKTYSLWFFVWPLPTSRVNLQRQREKDEMTPDRADNETKVRRSDSRNEED